MTSWDVCWDVTIPPDDPVQGGTERCVELPLALEVARVDQPGWVLDAGCGLNHGIAVLPTVRASVVHVTQAIHSEALRPRGDRISYVSADLRDLRIFRDGAFDRGVCVSTLEHIGMDNRTYGAAHEADPQAWHAAVCELKRVVAGPLLVTVPYWEPTTESPVPETGGRWQYFTRAHLCWFHVVGWEPQTRIYSRTSLGWISGYVPPHSTACNGRVWTVCAMRL